MWLLFKSNRDGHPSRSDSDCRRRFSWQVYPSECYPGRSVQPRPWRWSRVCLHWPYCVHNKGRGWLVQDLLLNLLYLTFSLPKLHFANWWKHVVPCERTAKRFQLSGHIIVFRPQTQALWLYLKKIVPCESAAKEFYLNFHRKGFPPHT